MNYTNIKPPPRALINPLHPLTNGLVGCWLINEKSGSNIYDISGKNNHGTLANMLPNNQYSGWSGSMYGSSLGFNGSNDHVLINNHPSLSTSFKCTIGALIYITGGDARKTIVSKWSSYFFEIVTNQLNVYLNGTSNPGWHVSNTLVPSNEWVFVAFTYDGSNVRFYQNGIEDTNTPITTGSIRIDVGSFYLGGINPEGQSRNLGGYIDHAYIFDITLSLTNIKQLHNNPLANIISPYI